VQDAYETARNEVLSQFQRDDGAIRADYDVAIVDIERQFGNRVGGRRERKGRRGLDGSSVLDDTSHESPRFQFETFRKRLTTTKDRLRDQRKEMTKRSRPPARCCRTAGKAPDRLN